jgi:hypothetical protein
VETIHMHLEYRLGLRLEDAGGDTPHTVLSFYDRVPPLVKTATDQSTKLALATLGIEVAALILAALATAGADKLTGRLGASLLVRKIVGAVTFVVVEAIAGVVASIPDIIAHWEEKALAKLPDFGALLRPDLLGIHWPGNPTYRPVSAQFRDGIQVAVAIG